MAFVDDTGYVTLSRDVLLFIPARAFVAEVNQTIIEFPARPGFARAARGARRVASSIFRRIRGASALPTLARMESRIDPTQLRDFITGAEDRISPRGVAALYGRAEMLARLPIGLQRWIVSKARGEPYMGFVVDPYCTFLAYGIRDLPAAERLLPPGYRLVPTAMFADEAPRVCAILGAFNVRASVFTGARVELYLIAEHTSTGMLTWVICDYESDTINYDPGGGFSGATTSRAVITTSHAGEVIIDVRSDRRANALAATAALPDGTIRPLDQRLWVDGNLSVDYGGRLEHADSVPFGLIFDPGEMARALELPLGSVTVERNTFGADFLEEHPFSVACFPYAQHFLTTSYPRSSPIRDRRALEDAVRAVADATRGTTAPRGAFTSGVR
ncbi:hypothetical protein [Agromyces marinus]|uniref:Uncharacterized protein n=1 Tax=Agromyces marinus TaxID=1389020 RepID=A0ABM8H5U7_9MICO|nr:hypothetical protein [Agromyces marinus]UIP58944.1 hypothetical protein DSM26151_18340 [Agromyces marinus]BDZ56090.1 hypothetical protein GCM10025870_31630 [Agromyces marinus]